MLTLTSTMRALTTFISNNKRSPTTVRNLLPTCVRYIGFMQIRMSKYRHYNHHRSRVNVVLKGIMPPGICHKEQRERNINQTEATRTPPPYLLLVASQKLSLIRLSLLLFCQVWKKECVTPFPPQSLIRIYLYFHH